MCWLQFQGSNVASKYSIRNHFQKVSCKHYDDVTQRHLDFTSFSIITGYLLGIEMEDRLEPGALF